MHVRQHETTYCQLLSAVAYSNTDAGGHHGSKQNGESLLCTSLNQIFLSRSIVVQQAGVSFPRSCGLHQELWTL